MDELEKQNESAKKMRQNSWLLKKPALHLEENVDHFLPDAGK